MEEEDFKKLPVEERCVHKVWKARVNGYEKVTKLFRQMDDEKSPEFSKYLGLIKKFVVDSNAMGQEKGLEAALAYVENYAMAGKTVNEVMSGVVAKCIAAPKTKTRELALQLTLMYIEIEKFEAVEDELIKGMEQKNPKIVAACTNACTLALKQFGSKVINVKPLVKKITLLFADRDKSVRDEARAMVLEIYRWIGGALRSQLTNLQPVQISDLESEFSKIPNEKPIPIRYIKSQQQKQQTLNNDNEEINEETNNEENGEGLPQIDPYDLADPVDILSKLPKDFYEKIEAKKWQERKDVLENLETLVKSPKLEAGDYGDLVRALKKVVQKDTNVVCVALAGRCIAGLANGLKKRFQIYSGILVSVLLEKFKEKKVNVVTAIRDAIDAVYLTTNIEAILEDVTAALANKNPSVKTETSLFLGRAFTKTKPNILNKKLLKNLTIVLIKVINEPDPSVRDAATEAIGTLMKLVGEKAIAPFLIELEKDNIKMTRIRECCDKAVVMTVKVTSKTERPQTATVAKVVNQKLEMPKSAPVANNRLGRGKKKTEISSGSATVVRSKTKTKLLKNQTVPQEKELTDEEVDELIQDIINVNLLNELASADWKVRLEAMEKILNDVKCQQDPKLLPIQAIIKTLCKRPGLKDTNFQVLKLKFDLIKYLIENSNEFSQTSANLCILEIAEKFGDAKNGGLVNEIMTQLSEKCQLNFVTTILLNFAFNQNQKNPKIMQECLLWLSQAIKEFGLNGLNTKLILESCKKALNSTNPSVRQSAITLLGVLYLFMGQTVNMFFEQEKQALKDQIIVECNKYENEKPPQPTKGLKTMPSSSSIDNLNEDGEECNLEDLLPRSDISQQITEALINECDDKNWKVRNEALIKIQMIIREAKFIKPNLGDLPQVLVHRLKDSNTKIAQLTLNICELITKSMGPPSKQYIKLFFPLFLHCLSDNKAWMRTTALETINVYSEQCGYKEFFQNEMIFDAIKTGSPVLRIELWNWLGINLPKIQVKLIPKDELVVLLPFLYSNLEDRNADVRKNAQDAIFGIMIHLGYEQMVKHTEKLKPGSKTVVVAALDKVRPNLPAKSLPPLKKSGEKDEKSVAIRGTKPTANSKNAVKSKNVNAKTSSQSSAGSSGRRKEEDIDTSPLLIVNNMKEQRSLDESKLKVLKWNFIQPREEFVDLLKEQMLTANINRTLISNMFHTDFRYHIKSIESLIDDLPNNSEALIANLDLILKWLSLRFFDTNPSVLLKGLEYLRLVFEMLIDNKYRMCENEASSFLPYLILKIGDPKDSVRNGVKSLFKQLYFIYPISRLFIYLMDGVKSKNARQRAECLDMMGSMLNDYGTIVCTPSPTACLKEIAKQISDRDNSVRNAALNCVVQAYRFVGEKVYKMVGNISDKDLSLLEERIKRSKNIAKPLVQMPIMQQQKENICPSRTNSNDNLNNDEIEEDDYENDDDKDVDLAMGLPPQIQKQQTNKYSEKQEQPFQLDENLIKELDNIKITKLKPIQKFDLEFLNEDIGKLITSSINKIEKINVLPLSPPKPLNPNLTITSKILPHSSPKQDTESKLLEIIREMASNDLSTAIVSYHQIQDFQQSNKDSKILVTLENEFMSAIIKQLKYLYSNDIKYDLTIKCYRNILTTIDCFYTNRNLGKQLTIVILRDLINEFITLLISRKLEQIHDGDTYVRIINIHCVKIIENANHTNIICALIILIHECIRNCQIDSRQTDLTMKCLWRVLKLMPTWSDDALEYEQILLEVHNFLKEFPTSWWKSKSSDTPLRTVKTVLHTCVKIKGQSIMSYLSKIPNTYESEVKDYILKILKNLKIDNNVVKEVPVQQLQPQRETTLSRETHITLTEIFQKIGTKEETKDGLNMLYDFMQQHPEADIDPFLKKSSKFFQDYIQNGLKDIEKMRNISEETTEAVVKKVVETIPMNNNINNNDINNGNEEEPERGSAYWRQRLEMWKKMIPPSRVDD